MDGDPDRQCQFVLRAFEPLRLCVEIPGLTTWIRINATVPRSPLSTALLRGAQMASLPLWAGMGTEGLYFSFLRNVSG
jgi:hypothetical protein